MIPLINYGEVEQAEQIKDEILQRYLVLKEGRTKEAYEANLKKFFAWLDERDDDQIRPDTLAEYKIYLQSEDLKPNTINAYLTPIKDFFKWCYEMDYMKMDVAKFLKMLKVNINEVAQARSLEDKEVMLLMAETNKNTIKDFSERIMLLCMFNLGLRISEIMQLKLSDIDLIKGEVNILGKGHKLRTLGLNPMLIAEIKEYRRAFDEPLKANDYIVQSFYKGRNLKPTSIQHGSRVLKRVAKRAGINMKNIRSHSGRVTAINHLLDKDVSIRDVANFAGHSSVDTTRRYDRKDQERIIETSNIIKFG